MRNFSGMESSGQTLITATGKYFLLCAETAHPWAIWYIRGSQLLGKQSYIRAATPYIVSGR